MDSKSGKGMRCMMQQMRKRKDGGYKEEEQEATTHHRASPELLGEIQQHPCR